MANTSAKSAEEKPVEEKTEAKIEVPVETATPTVDPSSRVRTRQKGDRVKFLNILDHGDSGSGKTRFAGSMIECGLKTLYIAFNEDEMLSLDQAGLKGYDYYIVKNYEKQLWPLYQSLRINNPKYQGVILDGFGDFQQLAKDHELAGGTGPDTKFMEEAMKGNKRMYLQNWGNLLEMTRHFLDPFLQLPMHKIITCISEVDEDPKTQKGKIYPGLQGSMQQLISAHFSVVAYSYIQNWGSDAFYCLTTQPHEYVLTKDRTNMNRVFVNPKFKYFLDAWEGNPPAESETEKQFKKVLILKPKGGAKVADNNR